MIKARYGTDGDVLDAPLLIAKKAHDMIRHYAKVVLPEGYKAQVVAASRLAAVRYQEALLDARDALVAELEALPVSLLNLSEDAIAALGQGQRERVAMHPQLPRLRALEFAAVISPDHNDPESWKDRRDRAVAVLTSRGITDLFAQVQQCVQLLADMRIRAEFINALRRFYETLNLLEHRPEVPPDVFRDAKLLGFINKVAANLYRDPMLNLLGVAEKVKALIDKHVSARGVDPKIPPTTITDTAFEQVLANEPNGRARAAQMQHAARFHITGFANQNPSYARRMSEKLEEILKRFKDDWDALERELRRFIEGLKRGDAADFPGLEPKTQVPFVRLMLEFCFPNGEVDDDQRRAVIAATLRLVEQIRREIRLVGFWRNGEARERFRPLSPGPGAGPRPAPGGTGERESRDIDARMNEILELDGLTFEVRRSARRRTLGLTVDRGGQLVMHAPQNADRQELATWAGRRLLWVHRTLARKERSRLGQAVPEYVAGETFR